jgi:hypothetical protein
MKLSEQSRYYLISFVTAAIFWLVFVLLEIEFINITFFIMAFIWHFALLAPGLRQKVFNKNIKFSFIGITIRINHYLQMFLPAHKIPYGPSLIRALSPLIFSFLLFVAGGIGNLFFTILGSFVFEVIYLLTKGPKEHRDDPEIPPAIPSEESVRE